MGRIAAGAVAGYILTAMLVVLTDQVFAVMVPGFRALRTPPLYYSLLSLATGFLYAVAGSYVCSSIAGARSWTATLLLLTAGEMIGLVSQIAWWNTVPHWFGLTLLVLYPAGVWVGFTLQAQSLRSSVRMSVRA